MLVEIVDIHPSNNGPDNLLIFNLLQSYYIVQCNFKLEPTQTGGREGGAIKYLMLKQLK